VRVWSLEGAADVVGMSDETSFSALMSLSQAFLQVLQAWIMDCVQFRLTQVGPLLACRRFQVCNGSKTFVIAELSKSRRKDERNDQLPRVHRMKMRKEKVHSKLLFIMLSGQAQGEVQ